MGFTAQVVSLWVAVAAKCAGRGVPQSRPARVGILRQGLAVAVMRGIAPQLQVLHAVTADPLPWWDGCPLPPQMVDDAGNVVDAPRLGGR